MKNLFLFFLLSSAGLHAQLDRFSPTMSEQEFIKAYPEATRDYEADSFWMNAWDTIEGTSGNSMWRILADTVTQYNFRSLKVNGPSYRMTTVDSSRVHKMRVSAKQLTDKLRKYYGAPAVLTEKKILVKASELGDQTAIKSPLVVKHEVYSAQWNFNDGRIILIQLFADIPLANVADDGIQSAAANPDQFELNVTITRSCKELPWKFQVGKHVEEFVKHNPRAQSTVGAAFNHVYVFKDKELSGNPEWQFVYNKSKLVSMKYFTAHGLFYGDESTEAAYSQCKYRAGKLLAEGQASLGKPDSVYNSIVPEYTSFNMETKYQYPYLFAEWRQPGGSVYLIFDELGGSREGIRFSVRVYYPQVL